MARERTLRPSPTRLSTLLRSPTSLLDYITIVPGLLGVVIAESAFDAQAWLNARTLRVFRIFRVVRMMSVVTHSGSSLQRQIAVLCVSVLSMVFCAAGIYQIVESTPDEFVPFHRAMMYMTIIVIGRPPVPTKTDAAVVMVTITIMLAASIIPAFVAELARLYFETQGSESYNSDAKTPHVVVCGDINSARLKAFLGQFFHKSREPDILCPVVVLSEHKYEGALRSLIEQQRYSGRCVGHSGWVGVDSLPELHRPALHTPPHPPATQRHVRARLRAPPRGPEACGRAARGDGHRAVLAQRRQRRHGDRGGQ